MKRREIEVWPAVADLMSGIAVLGLAFAAVMSKSAVDLGECQSRTEALEDQVEALTGMQKAVSVADDAMREVGAALGLPRQDDLSIVFGENVVSFATNQVEPVLTEAGANELRRFCAVLVDVLARRDEAASASRADLVVLMVEGHTDGAACPNEPSCNWRYSAERAARFRALLDDPKLCPGSGRWTMRPVGLANSQPKGGAAKNRRIELRLVPDYANILTGVASD